MSTEIIKLDNEQLKELPASRAEAIRKVFQPMADKLEEYENDFNDLVGRFPDDVEDIKYLKDVKRLRLDIGKIRINAGKVKAEQKAQILVAGRAIDGVYNILKWAVEGKEEKLKEIETHHERMEAERVAQLQEERVQLISEYIEDADQRSFGHMEDDVWNAYYQMKKKQHEDNIAAEKEAERLRIEREKREAEEREAERKRLAKVEAENKRIKAEQEKIRKEQERKDKLHKAELKKAADAEIAAKAKAEKAKKELAEKQKEAERLKAAAMQRKIEDERRLKAEEESKKKESSKSDKIKLEELAQGFVNFDATANLTTAKGKFIGKRIEVLLKKVADDITKQIPNLL